MSLTCYPSQVYHSVVNRNNADLQSSHSSEASGMEYIDDVHRSGTLYSNINVCIYSLYVILMYVYCIYIVCM